jgi:hypothetical protein
MASLGFVNEKTSALYTATLKDETGALIDGTTLNSATITAYDVATGTAIGARTAQNCLNTNGVAISSVGILTWTMTPADNAIAGTAAMEYKAATFTLGWGGASIKSCTHEMTWVVNNLLKVT